MAQGVGPEFKPQKKIKIKQKKIAIQAVREFHCDISMYICIITRIGSCPLYFYHSSPLVVISTGLKILYLFLHRKYINLIHLLNFLLLTSLSH
jgi:hypothetical protein